MRIQKIKEQIIEALEDKPKFKGNLIGGFISILVGVKSINIINKNE